MLMASSKLEITLIQNNFNLTKKVKYKPRTNSYLPCYLFQFVFPEYQYIDICKYKFS